MYTVWSIVQFTEQTLQPDEYGLKIFGNWNQHWSTELCGDHSGRSSRTRIVVVFQKRGRFSSSDGIFTKCFETNIKTIS